MKNFKKFSLMMMLTPVLFIGCVSEKTALIKPEVINKKITVIETNQSISKDTIENISKEDKLLASAIFGGDISINDSQDQIQINSNQELITQTLSLNDSWDEFTKEDEVLETARTFLGVKYIWAANGPFSFDCSGFTKYVFNKIGISLPRYSGHQANIGEKIKFSQMQKGDLVFFDTTKKFRKKVNHVGIFIGNNKFIHASSAKKKVVITSFSKKKFYKNKFLYARRIVNTNESFALNESPTEKDNLIN